MSDQTQLRPQRTRNVRAKIVDVFPMQDKLPQDVTGAWEAFRTAAKKARVEVGSTFTAPDGASHTLHVLDYPCAVVLRGAGKCFHNKAMDSYADPTEAPDAIHEVRTVDAELLKGVWSTRGEGGPRITDLARALAELSKNKDAKEALGLDEEHSDDEMQDAIDKLDKATRSTFAKHPAIAAKIAEIQSKRAVEKAREATKKAKGVAMPKLFG